MPHSNKLATEPVNEIHSLLRNDLEKIKAVLEKIGDLDTPIKEAIARKAIWETKIILRLGEPGGQC